MSEVVAALTSDELEVAMLVFESTCSVPGWRHASSEDLSGMPSCASSQQDRLSGLSSWHANRLCRGVSLRKHFIIKKDMCIGSVCGARSFGCCY